ncbi:DUF5667 domain-containing protein [Nitriliruptor alkaliphilus]|uniref:DUF5667 domain-containing protein n=1 Tax=Nitriliruptor alkaliphilus TaxID=427918 RepID=UPI0012ECE813|nr:DUF5667 domain-containing protein [Nitriliruptor alkaliphilus]
MTLSSRRERIDQLADLLDGTLADDEARSDVRRLATLASTVTTEVERPQLDEAERDRIRTRVMAAVHTDLQEAESTRLAPSRTTRSARTAVATGVASVLIGTGGVAVAAQDALPGDALYGIKQATESVRMAAAGDLTDQGRLELALATERLEEVTDSVARGGVRNQDLIDTLRRMDERSWSGAQTLVRVAERSGEPDLIHEVARFTERQASGIVDVFGDLPIEVRPHAEDSLATLRAIREQLVAPALGQHDDIASAELAAAIESLLRSSPLPPGPGFSEPTSTGDGSSTTDGATSEGSTSTTPSLGGEPLPLPGDTVTSTDDDPTLVPGLTGPLDEVGEAVDDTLGEIVDGTDDLVEDTVEELDDLVDDTVEVVDGLLNGALGTVGGLLGGTSTD